MKIKGSIWIRVYHTLTGNVCRSNKVNLTSR